MTRGGSTSPAPRGGPSLGAGADQGAVLRLLGTLREEIEAIRTKQAEIYEVVLSYKDQLRDLQSTVTESLRGLPKSPYIAGQLVPAPRKKAGVDDFRDLLATYLHGPTDSAEDEKPADVDLTPAPEPEPAADVAEEELEDEDDEDDEDEDDRGRHRRRGGRGRSGGPRASDEDMRGLNRGPERDVEPFDLRPAPSEGQEGDDEDERRPARPSGAPAPAAEDRDRGERRGRRRGRRGRRRGRGEGGERTGERSGERRDDRDRGSERDRNERDRDRGGRAERFEPSDHRDSAESSRFAAAVEAGGLSTASSGRLPAMTPPPEPPSEPFGSDASSDRPTPPPPPAQPEPPA